MESFAAYVEAERPDLSSPRKVADLLHPVLAGKMQEECHVLLLDTRNRLIRDETVTVGLAELLPDQWKAARDGAGKATQGTSA